MGWGYGHNAAGREVGYAVAATCDEPGCHNMISRGLAYCCGNEHGGGERGCGKYFCCEHLFYGIGGVQLCGRCVKAAPEVME